MGPIMMRAGVLGCLLLLSFSAAPLAAQPDTDPPVIQVLESGAPLADGALYGRAVTPVIQVTDASSVEVVAILDGGAFTSGTTVTGAGVHQLSVTATDAAENEAQLLLSFEIDLTPPVLTDLEPAAGTVTAAAAVIVRGRALGATAVTVEGTPATLAGEQWSTAPFALAEGSQSFAVVAVDGAGNTATATVTVVRDATAPQVTLTQPPAGQVRSTATVDVVGQAVDPHLAGVTVNGVAAVLSGSTFVARNVPLGEGPNPLAAVATDAAGNTATAQRSVELDTLPPTLALTDPAPGTIVPGGTLPVSGTVADPHLDRVEVGGVRAQVSGGGWSAAVPLVEGANGIEVTATDTLGHRATATVSVTRDSQAPVVRITVPVDGAYLQVATMAVSGTVEDEPELAVTVNGLAATVAGGTWSATAVPLTEGENRLVARVTDHLGNQGAHTRLVYRDTEAPELLGSDPATGALALPLDARFELIFSESMTPPTGGEVVLERIGGGTLPVTVTGSGQGGLRWSVVPVDLLPSDADLRLVLTGVVTDRAGNGLAPVPALTFHTVDAQAPGAPVLAGSVPAFFCGAQLVLTGTAEPGALVEVEGAAAAVAARADATSGAFALAVPLVPDRAHALELTATDRAGNRSAALPLAVTHDCKAPRVLDAVRGGDQVTVTFSEPVDPATVPAALTVSDGGGPLSGSVVVGGGNTQAVFTAASPLPTGVVRVEVGTAVRDRAGNPLEYLFSRLLGGDATASFLAGRVIDDATGQPLPGARVVVHTTGGAALIEPLPEAVTAADGRFRIPVAAGTHGLVAFRQGYTPVFRQVLSETGSGGDVFDPRLTPRSPETTVGSTGGRFDRGSAVLEVPAGAFGANTPVSVTELAEQGLPALLPFGWSPRGAVWVDLAGATLAQPAELTFPVEAPGGATVVLVQLSLTTLQWQVLAVETVSGGAVTLPITVEGAYAAVEADSSPTAPPAPTVGLVLGSAAAPVGDEATAAAITFAPAVVLPAQAATATVGYTLGADAASGLPLAVEVREELTLLDGTVRRGAPYEADLVLYRAPDGSPRSRFRLAPSADARALPLQMGAEDVTVRPYGGSTVQGNVLGPAGGTVTGGDGDRVDLPAGALPRPVPVSLERRPLGELPVAVPAGFEALGLLALELGGVELLAPAALSLELGAAGSGDGLLFAVVDLGAGPFLRPVAALVPAATGWTTAAIDPQDLPWPGVRRGGRYLFARRTAPLGYLRGTVTGTTGAPLPGALIQASGLGWAQVAAGGEIAGRYVLPVPPGSWTVTATDLADGNSGSGAASVTADQRVDLDLALSLTGPRVVAVNPADGTTGVPAGVEPTVTLSELPDGGTLVSGVLLLNNGAPVPVALELSGTLVRIRPRVTLTPGQEYEIRVTTALRDLSGLRLDPPFSSTFTVREATGASGLDLTRIHLFAPDGAGMARVLGRPGAVPAGALVFAENTSRFVTTPSVTAAADGSFELPIEAALGDVLLLHVLPDGANEVVVELAVYLTGSGRGGRVPGGDRQVTFSTVDGVTVTVPAGAFLAPAVVTVEPRPLSELRPPLPADFLPRYVFELDFGGAEARKAVDLTLPAPAADTGRELLLTRSWRIQGEDYWMVADLLRWDGSRFTTSLIPEELAAVRTSPEPVARLAALGAPAGLLSPQGGGGITPALAPATRRERKGYLPGSALPGQYAVVEPTTLLDFVGMPLPSSTFAYFLHLGLEGMVAVVNGQVAALLEFDAILIPTRRNQPFTLEGRDLATGQRFFEGTFDPPAPGDLPVLPPDIFGDLQAPVPVTGSPLRFFLLPAASLGDLEVAPGLTARWVDAGAGSWTFSVTAAAGTLAAEAQVRLLGLDDDVDLSARATVTGTAVITGPVTPGHRYVLALGGRVGPRQALRIAFSEALAADPMGIDVRDSRGRSVVPAKRLEDGGRTLRIDPPGGWRAGERFVLVLGPELGDAAGNPWGKTLDLEFMAAGSGELDTLELAEVRDVARLGSWLFVAGGPAGLVVVDAADPAALAPVVPGGLTFPFPAGDPVTGVAVDPHGRVLVVGGGIASFGQLKIFDPLALDPAAVAADPGNPAVRYAAFKGSTIVSDPTGGGTGSQLPEGTPRRVAVLSDDQRDRFLAGADPQLAGVTVQLPSPLPAGEYPVTLSGTGWTANRPVTLANLTRGRFARVDTDGTGAFAVTVPAATGDRLELLRNRGTLAYLATGGVGIEVVDVGAFYNETPEDPENPDLTSDVLGIYTGFGDPTLRLCNQPVSDIGGAILDLGTLFDPQDPHPLTVVGLVGFRGLGLFESEVQDVGEISFFNETCLEVEGSAQVAGLAVVEDYPLDLDGDGLVSPSEVRDYLVVAHRTAGVLVLDATDRDGVQLVGRIRLPGQAVRVTVDREARLLYVAASGGGLYVVDFGGRPRLDRVDANGDGTDDRLLEVIALEGNTNAPALLVPELGLAFAGGLGRGLTSIAVGHPRFAAVTEGAAAEATAPRFRPLSRLAPFGVPTATVDGHELPGAFHILAALPGAAGPQATFEVAGLGPGGLPVQGAGEAAALPGLPAPVTEVTARRLAENPWEEGYQLYLSDPVAVLAELRAARDYARTALEESLCRRCDQQAAGVPEGAPQVLSGHTVAVRLADPPPGGPSTLRDLYGADRLAAAAVSLSSVPWELGPSVRQEPTLNPSYGTGEVAPGTLLHSGEMSRAERDLALRGRGLDFVFERTYRNQTVGSGWSGRLGPGWDHNYNRRLRALPDGSVEHYDGRGRRELFEKQPDGNLKAPAGRFWTLEQTATGWVLLDERHNRTVFDTFGRLASIADFVKDSGETGNELNFQYDAGSRLARVTDTLGRAYGWIYDGEGRLQELQDFTGRTVIFSYDGDGRLDAVRGPVVTVGETPFPDGLRQQYTYQNPTGDDLAERLSAGDNLIGCTDPKGQTWLTVTYGDADGDGRGEEVTGQGWGGHGLTLAYDFPERQTTITDRRGHPYLCTHDEAGHPVRQEDPAGAVWQRSYDEEGLLTSLTEPLGRVTTHAYDTGGGRRSRGNLLSVRVTADPRGANGSSLELLTAIEYEGRTNQPVRLTDPRGSVTVITRDRVGLPTEIREAVGAPEERATQLAYNGFGQVIREVNPNGHETTYEYFGSGPSKGYLRQQVVDPSGLAISTRFETDPRGNVTAVMDPRGVRHERMYNEVDWPVEEVQAASPSADGAPALGYRTHYLYDRNGNLAELRRPFGDDGVTFTADRFAYGILDELLETRREVAPGGAQVVESYLYDENFNRVQHTAPDGQVTRWSYEARDLPAQQVMGSGTPEAVTELFAYDLERQRTGRTDGRSKLWTTAYDGYGRVREARDPLGNRGEVAYDDNGNRTLLRSVEGGSDRVLSERRAEYDLLDRPVTDKGLLWRYVQGETDVPAGARELLTRYEYDRASNLTRVTDPEDRVTTFLYDAAERRVESLDAAGNRRAYALDAAGNPVLTTTFEVVPGGGVEQVFEGARYDALNRSAEVFDGLSNTRRRLYDARSNLRFAIDPEDFATEHRYDGLDRRVATIQPEGIGQFVGYDASSRRVSYQDSHGNVTTWSYDALDRPVSMTYPDQTVWSTSYDAAHNRVGWTDPNGTVVTQVFDDANRLTTRTVTPGAGVIGPTTEGYTYDGLSRQTRAQSGAVVTDLTWDSLGRLVREETLGRGVDYDLDDVGNPVGLGYPSGYQVERRYDPLDRVLSVGERVTPGDFLERAGYHYRGPYLRQEKRLGNGITLESSFDAARRRVAEQGRTAAGISVFEEQVTWSARSLKSSRYRDDQGGATQLLAYDGAGRLTALGQAILPEPAIGPNQAAPPEALAEVESQIGYGYDAAQNLIAKSFSTPYASETQPLPPDLSGRNRPGSFGATALTYDANGNLIAKGDRQLRYDFRNRLTEVRDGAGLIASYTYDAFNRRVREQVDGATRETVWSGLQPLEEYEAGQLRRRRVYGGGLDEIVLEQADLTGVGTLSTEYQPLYDAAGNLVAATGADGRVLERYEYLPFGEHEIRVDATAPRVDQLRVEGGELWFELSEPVTGAGGSLEQQLEGGGLTLEQRIDGVFEGVPFALQIDTGTPGGSGQSLRTGVGAGGESGQLAESASVAPASAGILDSQRIGAIPRPASEVYRRRVRAVPQVAIAAGTEVRVSLAAGAVVDLFQNPLAAGLDETFSWTISGTTVVADTAPPEVVAVRLREGRLEVELSEEPDAATVAAGIELQGSSGVSWVLQDDRVTLVTSAALPQGTYLLLIDTSLLDLSGQALVQLFQLALEVSAAGENQVAYERPDERVTEASALGNRFGFHGLPRDPETGFVYVRNRYYDPELGRFTTEDPMGLLDGPSRHQFAGYDPVNMGDPLGLCVGGLRCRDLLTVYSEFYKANLEDAVELGRGVVQGTVATADYLTLGAISRTGTELGTFFGTDGSLLERSATARQEGLRQQLSTMTFGFSEAEDKGAHARNLVRGALAAERFEGGAELLAEGFIEGDVESMLRGGSEILGGVSQVTLLVAGSARSVGIGKRVPLPRGQTLRWGFWDDLPKVTRGGREYAQIGDRLYTQHAVERMTPRGFGTAARPGGVAGRGIPPSVVDDVLANGVQTGTRTVNGAARVSTTLDNVTVVTEGDIVITVITH
jgi:RHS repeat-associated protein